MIFVAEMFGGKSSMKLVDAANVQNAIFPMQCLNVTRATHPYQSLRKCVDFGGQYSGNTGIREDVFAPFDGTIVDKYVGGKYNNSIVLQSNEPVRFANGTVDYMCMLFVHDNDISDLWVGKQIKKGEVFYQEGNVGVPSDQIHVHLNCAQGKWGQINWETAPDGTGYLRNPIDIDQALFVDSTRTWIQNGSPFEYWKPAPAEDTTPPTITDLKYSEFFPNQFTISSHVVDESGIKEVRYAVWTLKEDGSGNNQDDLVWYDGHHTDNNNIFWARIPFSEHKNERGAYLVHAYATDNAGNTATAAATYYFEENPPVMSTPKIIDKDSTGYTITFKISDETGVNRVQFPTWTLNNDRDDAAPDWENNPAVRGNVDGDTVTFRVEDKDHNYEKGVYTTHIYAYDTYGNRAGPVIINVDLENTFVPVEMVVSGSHKYLLFDDIVTWQEAKIYCEKLGGHLVTITGEAEQNIVYSLVENRKRASYYIGLTDEKQEGNFQWVTNEAFSYTNWATGQPDNYGGNENYGVIYNEQNGLWNDYTNQNNRLGFVCEIEAVKGDLNNDGKIDIMDARKARRAAMKDIALTESELAAADLNGDGKVDIMEARKIKRAAMKEIVLE